MIPYWLSNEALADLRSIRSYLTTAPQDIRMKILNQLEAGFKQASDFPHSGLIETELTKRFGELARSILVYPYKIFYLPGQLPTQVFAVIDARQDLAMLLHRRSPE